MLVVPQELEVQFFYHLYSGQSAVNVATATSKCSITFLLAYNQDGDVKTKQDNVSNIL